MAAVQKSISIDSDVIEMIEKVCKIENRSFSNLIAFAAVLYCGDKLVKDTQRLTDCAMEKSAST